MLRVYLDQAKWIDFTKCRLGRSDGERYRDAFTVATEAVRLGRASFVLSAAHYYETHRRASWASRLDLATTMASLSKFHTIAPPHVIVPAEIDAAMTSYCGTRHRSININIFGVGINHAFSSEIPLDRMKLPDDAAIPPELRIQIRETFVQTMELAGLADPGGKLALMLETARKFQEADQKFADGQTALAGKIDAHKLRHRLGDIVTGTEIAEIIDPLIASCLRHGIEPMGFVSDRDRVRQFLEDLPSRWVTRELRRLRHRNPQQRWHPHDLNDVNALSAAVPYCDVVVTERQWARHINSSGLSDRYSTTVLHDLSRIPEALINATIAQSSGPCV
ncbi:hypothetical protein Franean1_2763 [Parafrankia sp. EAN1pec]|uniref:hypothetical protein n=1 Tax=Parafrankia sp. (strain EAN1pec) TaxID=298653 RepID=UPI0000540829|nr:hypothetical protein Franean1_2763 [Frankia sp. EAN1pec]